MEGAATGRDQNQGLHGRRSNRQRSESGITWKEQLQAEIRIRDYMEGAATAAEIKLRDYMEEAADIRIWCMEQL